MYKKLFIDITGMTILICMFAYIFSVFSNLIQIPYLAKIENYGQTMYYFDFLSYSRNVQNAFTEITQLDVEIPTKQWVSVGGLDWFQDLANNLAVMLNWVLFAMNIAMYVIRLSSYALRGVFVILGAIPYTTEYNGIIYNPAWFIETLTKLMYLQIPYIQ